MFPAKWTGKRLNVIIVCPKMKVFQLIMTKSSWQLYFREKNELKSDGIERRISGSGELADGNGIAKLKPDPMIISALILYLSLQL